MLNADQEAQTKIMQLEFSVLLLVNVLRSSELFKEQDLAVIEKIVSSNSGKPQ